MGWTQAAPGILVAFGLITLGCGSTASNSDPGGVGAAGGSAAGGSAAGGSAAAGAGDGSAAAGVGGEVAEAVPPLDGRWAMFSFEDPVAVELSEEAGVLSGIGCYGGLPSPEFPDVLGSCQKLAGIANGRHIQFSFAAENYTYAANVFASADGQRMAGDFHDTATWRAAAFAWLRIGADYPWLRQSHEPTASSMALEARSGRFGLEGLVDRYDKPGYLAIYSSTRSIAGSLGAFWQTEIVWNEAEQTLVAGPVAETAPEIATQLTLHFSGLTFVRRCGVSFGRKTNAAGGAVRFSVSARAGRIQGPRPTRDRRVIVVGAAHRRPGRARRCRRWHRCRCWRFRRRPCC
jgi:hypothetical protein